MNQPLTTREGQVYELIAKGMTNKEIGRALGISPNTVIVFVGKIFAKLGYNRRNQIILAASNKQLNTERESN
jgi:DNA-binding CsgD family transcriptional regulator